MYTDEDIVALRLAEEKKKYQTLADGIFIGEQMLRFREVKMFDNKVLVQLPEDFSELSPEARKRKYPSEYRPSVIISSTDTTVNFGFSLLPAVAGEIFAVALEYRRAIEKMHPDFLFLDQGELNTKNTKAGWFDFQSASFDGPIYNFYCFTPVEDKLLFYLFNCYGRVSNAWAEAAKKVGQTICDRTKEEN